MSSTTKHGVRSAVTEREDLEERRFLASQWQLMWWKFRKHRLAVVSVFLIVLLYVTAIFAEFIAPYDLHERHKEYAFVPPMRVRIFHEGQLVRPFVYRLVRQIDEETLRRTYVDDRSRMYPLRLFVRGDEYWFWGQYRGDLHLFGVEGDGVIFLLGTDQLGRDMLSRILNGARISLSIGFIGVVVSFLLGLLIGGVSGYFGGTVDAVIQRIIEIIRSFPAIPLWMAFSAALPPQWPPLRVYFAITVILSLVGWTMLARVVRGKLLALREEDFVLAARLCGNSEMSIIWKHLLPSFMSHLIVSITISIPLMILGETALSFLGLGLQPPVTSWGVLLQDAQSVRTVALHPWLMLPVLFVIVTVLVFNFIGDGLRDAADPYAT